MPTRRNGKNGRLEEAMALLIQNQAAFVSQLATMNARTDERFARIEDRLGNIEHTLEDHHKILLGLLESIRKEIGFKTRT